MRPTDDRLAIYCLPPIAHERRVALVTDGNARDPRRHDGYKTGAARVVDCAHHAARRGDIPLLAACILSPENVARRSDDFFAHIHRQAIRLGAAEENRRIFRARRIRCSLYGELELLYKRGGSAARVAHAFEALVDLTRSVPAPRLELVFGIAYDPELLLRLNINTVIRTGMEAPASLRLSGLRPHPGLACIPTTTLWRDFDPRAFDNAIGLAENTLPRAFLPGYDAAFVDSLLSRLAQSPLPSPIHLTLPVSAPPREIISLVLKHTSHTAICTSHPHADPLSAEGPSQSVGPQHEIHLIDACSPPPPHRPYAAFLSPGQSAKILVVPNATSLRYANLHPCEATPEGIVEGILRAHGFLTAHPPLLGAERETSTDEEHIPNERDAIADRFCAKMLAWARQQGLLLTRPAEERASINYVLTAFYMHYRGELSGWEEDASLSARCMLTIAASDEDIFDRVYARESPAQRYVRIGSASDFLTAVLRGETPFAAPGIRGKRRLERIAAAWMDISTRHAAFSHPKVFAGWRDAVIRLYEANVREYELEVVDNPLLARLIREGVSAELRHTIEAAMAERVPACVVARVDALLDDYASKHTREYREMIEAELRMLFYLADTAPSIAAGLLFRNVALRTPGERVSSAMAASLDRAAWLIDLCFRLANDMASLFDAPGGERDPKQHNACSILLPQGKVGRERARDVMRAASVAERVALWLGEERAREMAMLSALWPKLAQVVERGVFIGKRVYELGHYATLPRIRMSAIADAVETRLTT